MTYMNYQKELEYRGMLLYFDKAAKNIRKSLRAMQT